MPISNKIILRDCLISVFHLFIIFMSISNIFILPVSSHLCWHIERILSVFAPSPLPGGQHMFYAECSFHSESEIAIGIAFLWDIR